jgi:AcrR family transcriptional regulator
MTKQQEQAKKREPLSRERILQAAMGLADAKGIEALSMRNLAQALGVEAMSLYYHVRNKDDLLDGMADLVVGEIELLSCEEAWKAAMRRRALSAREVFGRHTWAPLVLDTRPNPGPASLRYYDSMIGCLRTNGFSIANAAHALAIMDAYIYGFSLQELTLPTTDQSDFGDLPADLLEALPMEEYPYFIEMITDHAMQPGYSFAAEFEFGLDLILDGLERLLDS